MLKPNWYGTPTVVAVLVICASLILLQNKVPHDAAKTHKISTQSREQKTAATPASPAGETKQGEYQRREELYTELRAPQETLSQTETNNDTERTTQLEPQIPDRQLSLIVVEAPLTPEQVVAYTTFINQYEKDVTALKISQEALKANSKVYHSENKAYQEKVLKHSQAVLTNRTDSEAGRITTEEYLDRYRLLLKEYQEVLPQESKRLDEMWQVLNQQFEHQIERERALKQRKPAVERARSALEAHINAK